MTEPLQPGPAHPREIRANNNSAQPCLYCERTIQPRQARTCGWCDGGPYRKTCLLRHQDGSCAGPEEN